MDPYDAGVDDEWVVEEERFELGRGNCESAESLYLDMP